MLASLLNRCGRAVWLNAVATVPDLLRTRRAESAYSSRKLSRRALWVEELAPRIVPAERIWSGLAAPDDFNWSSGANWEGGVAPGAADTVVFDGRSQKNALVDPAFGAAIGVMNITSGYTGTIAIERDLTVITSVTQDGGMIAGSAKLTIDNSATYFWAEGAWLGLGTTRIAQGGTLAVLGAPKYVTGRRLENAGTITWNGSPLYGFGAMVVNEFSGTFELFGVPTSFHDISAGLSSFINRGVFRQRVNTASASSIEIRFTNNEDGTIEVNGPRLTFTHLINDGTIDGPGILDLPETFTWRGGIIADTSALSTGTVVLGPAAHTTFTTFVDKKLNDRPMLNEGQVTWNDGELHVNGDVFTNAGTFSMVPTDELKMTTSGGGEFHNLPPGFVIKEGAAGTEVKIEIARLVNDGMIACDAGTLSIQSPGEHTGDFDVADNCTIEFDGGGVAMTTVVKDPEGGGFPPGFLGSGWYRVKNMMTLEIEAYIVTPQLFELAAGGVLGGLGTLQPSYMEWLPGSTMQDDGKVVIPSDGELYITGEGDRTFVQRSIVAYGWVTWEDGNIVASVGAKVTVDGSVGAGLGVFDCQHDGNIKNPAEDAGTFTVQNNGVLQKSGGGGTTDIQMLVEQKNGGKVDAMGRDLKTKAQENVSGIIELNGGTLTVAETFQQDGGRTALGGGTLIVAGATVVNGGTLTLDDGMVIVPNGLQVGAATVSGPGVIEGDVVTAGMWTLGDVYGSPEWITVLGKFTQAGGTLNILSGTFDVTEDFIHTAGSLFAGDGTLSVVGNFFQSGGSTTIAGSTVVGTLEVAGSFSHSGGSLSVGDGLVSVAVDYFQSGGGIGLAGSSTFGTLEVAGSFSQSGGTLTALLRGLLDVGESVTLSGGQVRLDDLGSLRFTDGLFIQSGGRLAGGGYLVGDVFNAGLIEVGRDSTTSFDVHVVGNYTQSSTGVLQFGSDAINAGGQLRVAGNAALAGTVRLAVDPGSLSAPMTITLVHYGSRSGTFDGYDLPPLSYGIWDPRYDDPEDTFTLWALETGS